MLKSNIEKDKHLKDPPYSNQSHKLIDEIQLKKILDERDTRIKKMFEEKIDKMESNYI